MCPRNSRRDATGAIVECDESLADIFNGGNVAYTEQKSNDGRYVYTVPSEDKSSTTKASGAAQTNFTVIDNEIYSTMIKSPRKFSFKTKADFFMHVHARKCVVNAANKTKMQMTSQKDRAKLNPAFWENSATVWTDDSEHKDVTATAAVMNMDAQSSRYRLGCLEATGYILAIGAVRGTDTTEFDAAVKKNEGRIWNSISELLVQSMTATSTEDWVPGDRGSFKNENEHKDPLLVGEYVIYVGSGKFYAHGVTGPEVDGKDGKESHTVTMQELSGIMKRWEGGDRDPADDKAPTVDHPRYFPKAGLTTVK
jgi:hypothetical protein